MVLENVSARHCCQREAAMSLGTQKVPALTHTKLSVLDNMKGARSSGSWLSRNRQAIIVAAIGLHVKLSWGIKLCKLQGRFLARVNNLNYIVNYIIFARTRDLIKTCVYFFRGHNATTLRVLQLSTPTRSTRKHCQHPCYPTLTSATTPILLTLTSSHRACEINLVVLINSTPEVGWNQGCPCHMQAWPKSLVVKYKVWNCMYRCRTILPDHLGIFYTPCKILYFN